MRNILWSFLLFCCLATVGAAQTVSHSVALGDSVVEIQVSGRTNAGTVYFLPHTNEKAAYSVADVLIKHGATVVRLRHPGGRNITFRLSGRQYEFDPNRMFSTAGIKASLQKHGATSAEAVGAVAGFAGSIERLLQNLRGRGGVLVALHNNTNGAYSVHSYVTGSLQSEAAAVAQKARQDPDNFYFTTDKRLYAALAQTKYNAVLQSRSASDDGSLSMWAARHRVPYVNIEAQHGAFLFQVDMVNQLQHARR